MEKFDEILSFVNNNFKEGDTVVQTKNFRALTKFIQEKRININEFDIEDYSNLIDKSSKLTNMITSIIHLEDYKFYMDNDFFANLALVYSNKTGVNINYFNDVDDNYYMGDLSEFDSVGIFFNDIAGYKVLSPDEEKDLFIRYNNGDESVKETIINHNIKLVVSIAKKYVKYGLDFSDLIQEGTLGLIKAIDKYDYTKGFKFSTYATWWIRQSITRSIANDSRTIRIPVHAHDLLLKISKFQSHFFQENGSYATIEELSEALNEPINKIKVIMTCQDIASINAPLKTDDSSDSELGDFIVDPVYDVSTINRNMAIQKLYDIIDDSSLSNREIFILTHRFGLNGNSAKTLEEVGKMMGVTRERIRQIESRALIKLKRNRKIREFEPKDFSLDDYDYPYTRVYNK